MPSPHPGKSKEVEVWVSQTKASPRHGFQESFYNNFKLELEFYDLPRNLNYAQIYNHIANQIDYYNNYRIHTSIQNIPSRFRQEWIRNNNPVNQGRIENQGNQENQDNQNQGSSEQIRNQRKTENQNENQTA